MSLGVFGVLGGIGVLGALRYADVPGAISDVGVLR